MQVRIVSSCISPEVWPMRVLPVCDSISGEWVTLQVKPGHFDSWGTIRCFAHLHGNSDFFWSAQVHSFGG